MLSLDKLEHFRVLARAGSYARAASELPLSQPALSRSIASLEAECGTRLVDRERGRAGVTLTPAGVALLDEADQLLRHARRVEMSMTGNALVESVQVRFGIGPLLASLLLSGSLARVMEQHPRASFSAVSEPPRVMRHKLLRGELDFFVAPVQVQPPDARIRTKTLGGQAQVFHVRPGHPLLTAPSVSADMMALYPLISGTVWNEVLVTLDRRLAQLLRPRVEIDNSEVLVDLATTSDAVLLFSAPVPGWGLEALKVDFRAELENVGTRTLDVHWRSGLELSDPAKALIDAMRSEFDSVFATAERGGI